MHRNMENLLQNQSLSSLDEAKRIQIGMLEMVLDGRLALLRGLGLLIIIYAKFY